MLIAMQREPNRQTRNELSTGLCYIFDRIIMVIFQATTALNSFVQGLRVGLKDRRCVPLIVAIYLDMAFHLVHFSGLKRPFFVKNIHYSGLYAGYFKKANVSWFTIVNNNGPKCKKNFTIVNPGNK